MTENNTPNRPMPPISGRWKPGQSGNPGGRPKKKPITEALQRVLAKLDDKELEELVREPLKKLAMGDIGALKEVTDRVEGKVVQQIAGSEDHGPIQVSWKISK